MSANDFTVKFGRTARTLEYDDHQGQLVFSVDLGSGGDKSLCLEHWSPQNQRVPRYRLAFERAKQYLESCGYHVETYGDFAPPLSMQASDISRLIQAELAHQTQGADFGFDLDRCLVSPTRAEFRCFPENATWDLWLVMEEPRHGLRVVFDEHSKQFGVAQRDIFEGFYGTFIQTLDAVSKVA
jgi:hypothetical protein